MIVQDRLRQFILSEVAAGRAPADLPDDYPLIETHVIDSLGIFQMVGFIESEFNVEIADEDLLPENFGTLNAMARLIEARRGAA